MHSARSTNEQLLSALREIAKTHLGDTPTQVLFAAHSMQATAIAAIERAGALRRAPAVAYREPSIADHEFGDYQPPDHDDDHHHRARPATRPAPTYQVNLDRERARFSRDLLAIFRRRRHAP